MNVVTASNDGNAQNVAQPKLRSATLTEFKYLMHFFFSEAVRIFLVYLVMRVQPEFDSQSISMNRFAFRCFSSSFSYLFSQFFEGKQILRVLFR